MTVFEGTLTFGYTFLGAYANLSIVQSFKPQIEVLTRTQFLIACNASTSQPSVVAIRVNLIGENLTSITLEPSQFPVSENPTQEELA